MRRFLVAGVVLVLMLALVVGAVGCGEGGVRNVDEGKTGEPVEEEVLNGEPQALNGALPVLKTGDSWVYKWADQTGQYTASMEIVSEDTFNNMDCYICEVAFSPALYDVASTMTIRLDKANLWPVKSEMIGTLDELPFSAAVVTTLQFPESSPWPLETGKEFKIIETSVATTTARGQSNSQSKTEKNTYKVEKLENVTVPAGTFECYKVVKYGESGNKLETSWHSDKVKNDVKTVDHETGATTELLSYKLDVPGITGSKVIFRDANLEKAIREALGKFTGDILVSDVEALTSLDLSYSDISSLAGLEKCINLTYLNVRTNTKIADISPLASLTRLTKLDLSNLSNSLNIAPLAKLTSLRELIFQSNWITQGAVRDFSPLSNLTGLTRLDIQSCYVRDISALATMTGLTDLDLSRCMCTGDDLKPLVGLVNLKNLSLYNTPYSGTLDIAPLLDNPGLGAGDTLGVRSTNLSDNTVNTYIPKLKARGVDVRY